MSNMKNSIYNNDGTLSTEALFFANKRPDNMKSSEFKRKLNEFRSGLTSIDLEAFKKLKRKLNQSRWRKENPTKLNAVNLRYKLNNADKLKASRSKWRKENYEKHRKTNAAWLKANPDKAKAIRQRSAAKSIKNKVWRSPKNRLRQAISRAFKRISQKKNTNTETILGCSYETAVRHIESLFREGMSWDNYGLTGWHIDHIRPLSSFAEEELHLANRIENLQPLWAEENIRKSDAYSSQ